MCKYIGLYNMTYRDYFPNCLKKYISVEQGGAYRIPTWLEPLAKKLEKRAWRKRDAKFKGQPLHNDGMSYEDYCKDPSLLRRWLHQND